MSRLLLLIGIAALAGATACAPSATATATPTPRPTATATAIIAARPTSTPTPTPPPTPSGNIVVAAPAANAIVSSPLTVSGRARVFEAVVLARLRDASGTALAQGQGLASEGAPGWGDFVIILSFPPTASTSGQVEVFNRSPKDGSEQNRVVVPVRLQTR